MQSLVAALVKALPAIVQIAAYLFSRLHDRGLIADGEMQAIARQVTALNSAVSKACAARQEAEERHAADPTDNAFDRGFERRD